MFIYLFNVKIIKRLNTLNDNFATWNIILIFLTFYFHKNSFKHFFNCFKHTFINLIWTHTVCTISKRL